MCWGNSLYHLQNDCPYPWLLLSNAVHTTAVGEGGSSVSLLHAATWIEPREKIERDIIIRIVEGPDDDESVADVVIDVREVGPLAIDF